MFDKTSSAINRRSLLKGAAALSGAAALGPRIASARPAAQSCGKMTVWGVVSFTPEGDQALGKQMAEWGKANGVEVEYVPLPGSDYVTKLATAVESGAVPDIAMMQEQYTIFYAAQDRLVDLTGLYNNIKGLAGGMYETLMPNVTANGKVYAIPMESNVSVMYARLDLIEKATGERKAPETLDALEEVAGKVNDPPGLFGIGLTLGRTPDTIGGITQLILADGGTLVDKDGKPAINNPGTVSALTRVKHWWDNKLIPPGAPSWDDAGNNTAYQSGQAAFVFNPASIYGYLEQNDKDLLADTTQAPFPKGTAGSFPAVTPWSWAVFKKSQCGDAAQELITALMQPDKLEEVYEAVGGRWYPVYRDLTKSKFWTDRPAFASFPEIIESSREPWYPAKATPELLTQLSAVYNKLVLADMAQDVVVNGTSPEDAAKTAQTKMEQAFKEAAGA
jgi:multiple sugar transport system substrate-binding protein